MMSVPRLRCCGPSIPPPHMTVADSVTPIICIPLWNTAMRLTSIQIDAFNLMAAAMPRRCRWDQNSNSRAPLRPLQNLPQHGIGRAPGTAKESDGSKPIRRHPHPAANTCSIMNTITHVNCHEPPNLSGGKVLARKLFEIAFACP